MTPQTAPPALSEATLADLRRQIDTLDATLLMLVARRCGLVRRVQWLKRAAGLPARSPGREQELFARAGELAQRLGVPGDGAAAVLRGVLHCSLRSAGVVERTEEDGGEGR